jgi:glycosyltransferase involved in cell wall biosynthesis
VRDGNGRFVSARVVHVTTTDISLVLLLGRQLSAMQDAGYEVIGVSAPGPYVERLSALGVRHVPLQHATRSMAPLQDVAALGELARIFSKLRPDIVHTHNPKPGVYGRLSARFSRVPVIVNTVHGLYAQPGDAWSRRTVVYGLERIAAKCSQAELVQNVEDLPVLRRLGLPEAKLHLLGNGIDLSRFDRARVDAGTRAALRASWGVKDDAIVCGAVGRLVWEKGYREVIEAARLLRDRAPHVEIVVVGPLDEAKAESVTRADIEAAESLGNIHFVGERADIESCYAAFDLYVLASYREGFPRSAMEAAAMELPVVATNIRGCRQVVDDGRTGRLVPVRNAPAIADAVAEIATDDALRREMGNAARAKAVADFDEQRCIDLTLDVYGSLLERNRAGVAV